MHTKNLLSIFFVLFTFNQFVCGSFPTNDPLVPKVIQFSQKVDHFDYDKNNEQYTQRVVMFDQYWGGPGYPVFFYAGNEGDVFAFVNNTGFMFENGKIVKAMIIFAEHRYYGESFPTNATPNENPYRYLSVEQALADYAYFIQQAWQDQLFPKTSPVITFGGSYGGMLAAWFRQKYPHLTIGALAGSAPVAQFLGYYDCGLFNQIVTKDYRTYSEDCYNGIKNSWNALRNIHQKDSNQLVEMFGLCSGFDENSTIDNFIDFIVDVLTNVAMTDYPNASNFLKPMPAYPMKEICKKFYDPSANDVELIQQLRDGLQIYFNYTGTTTCIDWTGDSTDLGAAAWNVQYCTELFLPVCQKGGDNDFFEPKPIDIDQFTKDCQTNYFVTPDFQKAELLFGIGVDEIKSTSRIIFSNGGRDPWSTGGILQLPNQQQFNGNDYFNVDYDKYADLKGDLNVAMDNIYLFRLKNSCHHEDLRSTGKNDSISLKGVRLYELKLISTWIQQFYDENSTPSGWYEIFKTVMNM